MKALIVYGTRYGATESTASKIAKVLREEGVDTRTVNIGLEKVNSISEYDLIIVGSGIKMNKWTKETEKFLKKHLNEISRKKIALFVSSGTWPLFEKSGPFFNKENCSKFIASFPTRKEAYQQFLVEKAKKFSLNPVSMGLFGGIFDFDKMGRITAKLFSGFRKSLEEKGINTSKPYDNRDFEAINKWARDLVLISK